MNHTLHAPNGKRIVGAAEELHATAGVIVTGRRSDGSLQFAYEGESTIYWETQQQRRNARGERLWTDTDGRDWPESSLSIEGEPSRPTSRVKSTHQLYRLSDAAATTIIAALRLLQRDQLAQAPETGEPCLTLEEIDALCERLNLAGDQQETSLN